jgi:hypothetical protein
LAWASAVCEAIGDKASELPRTKHAPLKPNDRIDSSL